MHGPLSEIGLIEVLQLLERGRRSGALHVTGGVPERTASVHLRDGGIVAVDPDAGDDALRSALVGRYLASESESQNDSGLLAREDATALREELALHALGTMLHWRAGRFDFRSSNISGGPLSISPDALVFQLVESETRRVELSDATVGFRVIPAFAAPEIVTRGDPPALTPRDWRVLDVVDGTRDIAGIAAVLGEPLEDIAARVQWLEAAAILELNRPGPDLTVVVRSAIEAGRYNEAAQLLQVRLASYPADADAWRVLGLAEVGAGRFERAIEAWQSWRASDPEHAGDAVELMQAARTMVEALRDSRD
ncbi:MAG: DUF4388 domain-containing protein [Gemmatimonadales bacterium]